MPLGPGVRYRWTDPGKPGGKKVRLAFKGNTVIEVKKEGSSAKLVNKGRLAKKAMG